eukprot:gnl/TRDRNA2_/TRDRNA2_177409_c0_seq3.p1 gnl/TRDRNA2_/TRDRNA2_177409_c0~~gnl/TRDRNA2_/TRDRNA2_177409_c0_seq3.p1  ORF type:complete len:496 (+),score=68.50 gnl/TRDRNA2_/TRDRNA2_177409_c0_seq3:94-1488(+)
MALFAAFIASAALVALPLARANSLQRLPAESQIPRRTALSSTGRQPFASPSFGTATTAERAPLMFNPLEGANNRPFVAQQALRMPPLESQELLGTWNQVVIPGEDAKTLKLAYQECEEVTKEASKTFHLATALLQPAARKHAWAIYAWCRRTDDIVDSPEAQANPQLLDTELEEWNRRLNGIWKRTPADMYDLALADTVRTYPTLDIEPFREMIEGMVMDVPGHAKGKLRYQTFDELYLYCYRVAGTVGLMMLPLLGKAEGVTEAQIRKPAIALGIAFQLTNILRDVGEDLERGRIYLPLDEIKEFGLTEEDLSAGVVTEKYKDFIKFQIARARAYYKEAEKGISMLNPTARFAVRASLDLYGKILTKIEENDYDNFNKRAYVSGWEKLAILPGSWAQSTQYESDRSPVRTQAPAVDLISYPRVILAWSTIASVVAGTAVGALVATAVALRHRARPVSADPLLG